MGHTTAAAALFAGLKWKQQWQYAIAKQIPANDGLLLLRNLFEI